MTKKIVNAALAVILCVLFVLSVIDTAEVRQTTNFSQENIMTHIEKLSENGPRSIADPEANAAAIAYIVSQAEASGAVNEETTEQPAYLIQDFVGTDQTGRYQNWYLQNVIVHIPANGENPTGDAVMFMGHFDSVPMGQGSSDDGVACAVMLEAIRYYTDRMAEGYTLNNDLVFCFVNGEEYNLFGSRAFMNEFEGFDNIVDRIKFGTNLESRGTSGTLIMFETAKNNYNTVKLFSEVNKSLFTCSIATMVYDTMPNSTDFTNFKEVYQGLNMANITGGEDYHTQNDSPANVGASYLSQQAQIVDGLIDKLADYELEKLYDADESALFFSYLNLTTVVYHHTTSVILAVAGIVLLLANILLSAIYRKERNLAKTAKAILAIVAGLVLTAVAAYLCYYLFQLIAALFGVIDIHMIGTITYSNTAIVVGLGILALAVTVLTTHFACKWLKLERRDMTRAFAYIHVFLGIVVSFVIPDAGYLFMFSGLMLTANELLITCLAKTDFAGFHGELLATALYFPIVIPVIVLATSALGLTMAYVYGLVFALAIFGVGICITPLCRYLSIRSLIRACRKKAAAVSSAEGALHILTVALLVFLCVSLVKPNASVNLQGKQNIVKLPYDDALVYAMDESGEREYRIYDLNAVGALEAYAPDMKYNGEYYYCSWGEMPEVEPAVLATAEGHTLTVKKNDENSLVYLDFTEIHADSFTIRDGVTEQTYLLEGKDTYTIKLHSDCTVTLNGGTATVAYREVLRDYAPLIPAAYESDPEQLHFNLWLTAEFTLSESEREVTP
ncbi:MAG: M28 family peptidase [Clostridia bacterium]|nr:M28 family peptidase [Clostridia bacterium]